MVKYFSLAPKEGKNDPREGPDSELNKVCMVTGPLGLRTDSIEMHPTLAEIGDAIITYPPTPAIKGSLRSLLSHVGYYKKFVWKYVVIIAPLKDFLTKAAPFFWDDTCRANISLGLKYLGLKAVLGEDAQEAQLFKPSVAGMQSA